jgi:uncharacterized lipoprotein YddW (UPF0748 family)
MTTLILLLVLAAACVAAGDPARKVRLSSPITHSDWMLRDPAPKWGPEGVHQILDRCKQCGWTRVYWRCFDGGRALYHSKLMDPAHGYDEDNYHKEHGTQWVLDKIAKYDWGEFDAFQEAVAYGHQIGLEVHAWLSLNEDDHGWGLTSRFTREHPESRWVRRDGRRYRSQQSFAFPEVRAYKLALVREILAYHPDGIFFDWIRTGDVRDNPQTDPDGVANYGYEAPNVERFKAKYDMDPHEVPNNDERWVRLRAEPQTEFMREAAAVIRAGKRGQTPFSGTNPKMGSVPIFPRISALVQHPWSYRGSPTDTPYADNLRGLLVDTRTWAREGLVDEVVAAGDYRPGGTPELAWKALHDETEGRVPVWLFGWIRSPEEFASDVKLAERLRAPELLLWESDYIALPPANEALVLAMGQHAHSK